LAWRVVVLLTGHTLEALYLVQSSAHFSDCFLPTRNRNLYKLGLGSLLYSRRQKVKGKANKTNGLGN
jgi:hypothetical protein